MTPKQLTEEFGEPEECLFCKQDIWKTHMRSGMGNVWVHEDYSHACRPTYATPYYKPKLHRGVDYHNPIFVSPGIEGANK